MSDRANLRDGSALVDLQSAIASYRDGAHSALTEADASARETRARLEEQRERCRAEAARCEADYFSCRSHRDDDGCPPPCSAEAAVLQAAEERLEQATRWCERVEQAVERYGSAASTFRSFLNLDAIRANSFLGVKLRTVEAYSEAASGLTAIHKATASDHGSEYSKAKQQMLRDMLNDPNQGRATKGWIRQEINRLNRAAPGHTGQIRMPNWLDAGHRVPGDHTTLRPELRTMNRGRYWLARRLGLASIFR